MVNSPPKAQEHHFITGFGTCSQARIALVVYVYGVAVRRVKGGRCNTAHRARNKV